MGDEFVDDRTQPLAREQLDRAGDFGRDELVGTAIGQVRGAALLADVRIRAVGGEEGEGLIVADDFAPLVFGDDPEVVGRADFEAFDVLADLDRRFTACRSDPSGIGTDVVVARARSRIRSDRSSPSPLGLIFAIRSAVVAVTFGRGERGDRRLLRGCEDSGRPRTSCRRRLLTTIRKWYGLACADLDRLLDETGARGRARPRRTARRRGAVFRRWSAPYSK